jgi:hypothetical protein
METSNCEHKISYYEKNGRIGIKYWSDFYLEDKKEDYYPFDPELMDEFDVGLVPSKIQQAGKQSIAEYARKACQIDWQKRTQVVLAKLRSRKECINDMNIPITISHSSGVLLEGRIIKNPKGYGILVTLEGPFKSEKGCVFNYPTCFAASVGGMHVYKKDGTLTDVALKDSRDAIVKLYKEGLARQKHGDVLDIIESLNSADAHED